MVASRQEVSMSIVANHSDSVTVRLGCRWAFAQGIFLPAHKPAIPRWCERSSEGLVNAVESFSEEMAERLRERAVAFASMLPEEPFHLGFTSRGDMLAYLMVTMPLNGRCRRMLVSANEAELGRGECIVVRSEVGVMF